MDHIVLGEKTFVKANVIARELGYTSDYIGQLCRGGKVESKLVGRSWYVNEHSIREHKQNRYRSIKAVAKKDLHTQVQETAPYPPRRIYANRPTKGNFYEHHTATLVTPQYDTDATELIPMTEKRSQTHNTSVSTGEIKVTLAEAEQIAITRDEKQTTFVASELPELRFKGELEVFSAEDVHDVAESVPEESEQVGATMKDSEVEKGPFSKILPIKNREREVPILIHHATLPKQSREDRDSLDIVTKQNAQTSKEHTYLTVTSMDDVTESNTSPYVSEINLDQQQLPRRVLLTLTACLSLIVALSVLSIEHHIAVDEIMVTKSYSVEMKATLYNMSHILKDISSKQ